MRFRNMQFRLSGFPVATFQCPWPLPPKFANHTSETDRTREPGVSRSWGSRRERPLGFRLPDASARPLCPPWHQGKQPLPAPFTALRGAVLSAEARPFPLTRKALHLPPDPQPLEQCLAQSRRSINIC